MIQLTTVGIYTRLGVQCKPPGVGKKREYFLVIIFRYINPLVILKIHFSATALDYVIQIGKSILSWAGGIILAVLPKCPFCYITYTNSIVICGLAGSEPESFLDNTLIFSFTGLTILVLLFNFRGWRTIFSMVLVGLGATVFVYVLPATANHQLPYIIGSILIICGVFLNRRRLVFKSLLKEKQIMLTSCMKCGNEIKNKFI